MSQGTSEALRELLIACSRADQVAALHTLGLHPGLINEHWAGNSFEVAGLDVWVNRVDTAIMVASRGGNEALVQELVTRGARLHARSEEDGRDALMWASWNGHTAVVAVLLNHGADPNTRNQDQTALGLAAARDYLPICLLLVARAADLYAVNADGSGRTALEGYGHTAEPRLSARVKRRRREALNVAYDEGPHPNSRWSQTLSGLVART